MQGEAGLFFDNYAPDIVYNSLLTFQLLAVKELQGL